MEIARYSPTSSSRVPVSDVAVPLVVALVAACLLGLGVALIGPPIVGAAIAVLVAIPLLRHPAAGVLAILVYLSLSGSPGAHVLVPGLGLPLVETVLVVCTVGALARVAYPSLGDRAPDMRSVLIWVPASLWACFLIAGNNHGLFISGTRDAFVFIYPLLIAVPLSTIRSDRLRTILDKRMGWVVALGAAVAGLGLFNYLTDNTLLTNTGQLRYLGSTFAPPLFAAIAATLYIHARGRVSDSRALAIAAPAAIGILMVNHRSAYLALIVALAGYAFLTALSRNWTAPPLWRVMALGGAAACLVLLLTPVGQAGFARLASITNTSDPNIAGRVELSRSATELHGSQWIEGAGVGKLSTTLDQQENEGEESARSGFHNSFLSVLHTGGLIGFLVLVTPIGVCVVQMLRRNRDVLVRVLLSVTVFSLIMAATNVFLENSYGSVWVWFPIIIGWRLATDGLNSDPDPPVDGSR